MQKKGPFRVPGKKPMIHKSPRQVEEFLAAVVDPILEANRDLLGDKAEINV